MKRSIAVLGLSASALLSCLVLTGCHVYARLFPVEGPLSQQTPPPVYAAKIIGGVRANGFSAVIGDGETVSCTFQNNLGKSRREGLGVDSSFDMRGAWDAVYGDQFYKAHVLGSAEPYYWCDTKGSKGTSFHVALQVGAGDGPQVSHTVAVAEDDKNNIFKLTWSRY